jgi:voltage-gated potassium channel Kch
MRTELPQSSTELPRFSAHADDLAAWLKRLPEAARGPAGSLLGLMLAGAAAFYLAEREANHKVESVWDALWWALATVSTVGYGDIVPLTGPGRAVGSIMTVVGGRWYQQLIEADGTREHDLSQTLGEILERLQRIEAATAGE